MEPLTIALDKLQGEKSCYLGYVTPTIKKEGRKDLTTLNNYSIVKQIFLKYNTTLPSSAPVERLFSSGSQILAPRRNRLGDKTFEMLVCVKSNKIND